MQPAGVQRCQITIYWCPLSNTGMVTGLWDGRPRNRAPFASGAETIISSSTKTRPALRLLTQWAPGTYSAVKKGPQHEADHSPTPTVEVKYVELYLQSPTRLHGVVLNYILFVNFWPVKNPEKLTGGPTVYVTCQGHSICTAPSANPPSLSPYLALPPPPI